MELPPSYDNLFRMQNVATRRRDRINSDEEERFRLGYELKTGVRFALRGGVVSARQAQMLSDDGQPLVSLVYGHGAALWRMNLGWRRRKDRDQTGYVLDIERGYWAKSQVDDDDPEDPLSPRTERAKALARALHVHPAVLLFPGRRGCLLMGSGSSHALGMKTAVSVHNEVFERAERLAKRLKVSRRRVETILSRRQHCFRQQARPRLGRWPAQPLDILNDWDSVSWREQDYRAGPKPALGLQARRGNDKHYCVHLRAS